MRQLVSLAAKVAISALLLYFALSRINLAMLGERLRHINIGWLLAAVALTAIQVALASARWQRVALQCGAELSLPRAFRLSLIATFFNQVLPSTVGGDAIRVWMLARGGAGWEKATYSVLLDRFIGVLALAVLVVLCLPWTLALIQNPIGRITLLAIGFGGIAGAAAFMALGYVRWAWLQRWWPTRHLAQALTDGSHAADVGPTRDGGDRAVVRHSRLLCRHSLVRGARGRGAVRVRPRAVADAARHPDRHRADLDRRLGSARERADAGL